MQAKKKQQPCTFLNAIIIF